MKTAELTGAALDWVVAKCQNIHLTPHLGGWAYASYSTNWAQGGPIIAREKISIEWTGEDWMAYIFHDEECFGPTPLIASMRCYVASKLGDEVEVPDELLEKEV